MTVVDASVAVKWFLEEPNSAAAREILGGDEALSAPGHLTAEVGRGLLRSKRAGAVSLQDAKRALTGLSVMVSLAPTETVAELAFDIADRSSVTIYDALYVALAEQTNDVLVTADQRLCDALARSEWAGRAQHLRERAVLRGIDPDG